MNLLERKGFIATIVGVIFIVPILCRAVLMYFNKPAFSVEELWTIIALNDIAWVWVILPSEVLIEVLNKFKFSIKD